MNYTTWRSGVSSTSGSCRAGRAAAAAPPLNRQLRRCISWRNTISNQLKSLAAALLPLLLGGDCHGLNIAVDLILNDRYCSEALQRLFR